MLKVLVTGAYSTGKTTLIDELAKALRDAGYSVAALSDVARDCPMPLNLEQTEATTLWLLSTQIARELETLQMRANIILCDRGVPDIRAHYEEVAARLTGNLVPRMASFLDAWTSLYDLILFSRIDSEIPIQPDGLRSTDPAYRIQLDEYAANGLAGYGNVRELPLGGEERLRYALKAVLSEFSDQLHK